MNLSSRTVADPTGAFSIRLVSSRLGAMADPTVSSAMGRKAVSFLDLV